MGLYNIKCNQCSKDYVWFSGNVGAAQVCPNCQREKNEPKGNEYMEPTLEQQLIDTLKSAIAAKDDLIDHLKKEIQRLDSVQISTAPPTYPNYPLNPPTYPGTTPFIQPNTGTPWIQPPYIITSGEIGTATAGSPVLTITGGATPLGSQQYPSAQMGSGCTGIVSPAITAQIQATTRNG